MNKRVVGIGLNINAVRVNRVENATQGDTNTHFLHLTFDSGVELEGYNLQVTYMPPYPETVPYVDVYTDLKQELDILIPNILLRRTGEVRVNFALSKGEEILTVNKSFTFEVIKTINGASITAFPEGNLKLTLAQQIEKVTQLLEEAEEKVNDYNDSVIEKTNEFNENARTKTEEFDTNTQTQTTEFNENSNTKTTEFNQNVTTKTNEFNTLVENSKSEIEDKATESANTASTEANKQVVAQQEKSIQAVQETGTAEVGKVTSEGNTQVQRVTDEGTKQVQAVQTQGTTTKEEVVQTGTNAVNSINTAKSDGIEEIGNATSSSIRSITGVEEEAIRAITESANTVVESVTTEGNRQIENVANKGIEQIEAITTEGINQAEGVTAKSVEQIENIKTEGLKSLNSVREVQTEIENLLNNQEVEGNALSLNGKTGVQYDKEIRGVVGGYDGVFPLTIAELNKIYLQKETGKFYVCIKAYNGTRLSAPNANFEELSVYKNRDKLGNLNGNNYYIGTTYSTEYAAGYIEINTGLNAYKAAFYSIHISCFVYRQLTFNMLLSVFNYSNGGPMACFGAVTGIMNPDVRAYINENNIVIIRVAVPDLYYTYASIYLELYNPKVNNENVLGVKKNSSVQMISGNMPDGEKRIFKFN